jgi:GDPmannose 4,6-dehydratase
VRHYQASSSEMFGATNPKVRDDRVPPPLLKYGAAKMYAFWMAGNYREAHGNYAVNGILFKEESCRSGKTFVTRNITMADVRIATGLQSEPHLGHLDARCNWGYASEYVEGMWRMLDANTPDAHVLATSASCSAGDFVRFGFRHAGLDWHDRVRLDPRYLRPTEVADLTGDPTRATRQLGLTSTVHASELTRLMVDADCEEIDG